MPFYAQNPYRSRRVYINRSHPNCCWYMLGEGGGHIPIEEKYFQGIFVGCAAHEVERRGKPCLKLYLVLQDTDEQVRYEFELNPASVAGRSLLAGLSKLSKENALISGKTLLGLQVREADTAEEVVFLSLYQAPSASAVYTEATPTEDQAEAWARSVADKYPANVWTPRTAA